MKKSGKLFWTTAAAVLLIGVLGTGALAYSGGSGTQEDPYQIAGLEDLKELRDTVNGGEEYRDVCFLLTEDVELDCDFTAEWIPIGTYGKERRPFRGVFDGGGHIISNLYISNYYEEYQGLFGYIEGGAVRNLGVVGSISFRSAYSGGVTGGSHSAGIVGESRQGTVENCWYAGQVGGNGFYVGGIVGYNRSGTVKNCYVMGKVELENYGLQTEKPIKIEGGSYVGGVVGENDGGTVTGCHCDADKVLCYGADESNHGIGGVVGYNNTSGTVENCYNTASISDTGVRVDNVGGVVGSNDGRVSECHNTGKVYSIGATSSEKWGSNVGGVVGSNGDYASALVENCYNTGKVTGTGMGIGGVAGSNGTRARIQDCRNEGLVLGTSYGSTCMSQWMGGIVGKNSGSVEDCRNAGKVKNDALSGYRFGAGTGGVVGRNEGGKVRRCYNTGEVVSTNDYVGGVIGDMNWGGPVVEDCWNSGSVTGVDEVGGVAGRGRGKVIRCLNLGPVATSRAGAPSAPDYVGGVVGQQAVDPEGFGSQVEIQESFYLDTTAAGGFQGEDLEGQAERRTAQQLASGEVAWLLQGDRESLVWGQSLGADSYPALTGESARQVRRVSFRTFENGEAVSYATRWVNDGKPLAKKDIPVPDYEEPWDFYRWSRTADKDGAAFEGTGSVDGDLELYALFREYWRCHVETLWGTCGQELTQDLSEFIHYEGDTSVAGRFRWTVAEGNEDLGASLSGDTLTVPETAEQGEYELVLQVEEQGAMVTLQKDQPPQPVTEWESDPLEISLFIYMEAPADTPTEERPSAEIDYELEELMYLDEGTYRINGEEVTLTDTCWPIPEECMGTTVSIVRVARDDTYKDSSPQRLSIPTRPQAPTGVTAVNATGPEEGDGKLEGLEEDMEYQLVGEEDWISAEGETATCLEPGTYRVRYECGYDHFAGKAVEVEVGVDGEDPDPDPNPDPGPDPDPDPNPDTDHEAPDPVPERPQPVPSDDDDDDDDDDGPSAPRSTSASKPETTPKEQKKPSFSFTDVRQEDWYYTAVEKVCARGLMRGVSDTRFRPEKPLTRMELVTVLYRMEGSPAASGNIFVDIPQGPFDAVVWAAREGLVKGFGDGTFRPDADVTREQLATILWRYAMWKGWDKATEGDLSGYMDTDQISPFALKAMKWANGAGLISGTDWGGLAPQTETSRGEAAAVFVRCVELHKGKIS